MLCSDKFKTCQVLLTQVTVWATVELCSTQIHEKLRVTVPGSYLAPGVKVGDLCANFYFIWRRNMEHAQGDGNEKDT